MTITESALTDRYYEALVNREAAYVGIFFVGVKTTSIFCIATCRARKPKRENVEFFSDFKSALAHGYRPCKICKPTEHAHQAPTQVEAAIALVRQHPKSKITDAQLRAQNIRPEAVRRWFKQHYGMTFQAFQRLYRINIAYNELKAGKNTTTTAFESGYESLSGFGYTYKKIIGKSPTDSLQKKVILINRFTTPLGPMFVGATYQGICLLEFVDRRMLETEFKDLQRLLQASILIGDNAHTLQAKQQLAEYFAGQRHQFDLPLHHPGTPFQQRVWQSLLTIPYGQTTSYQAQAQLIQQPKAIRALASANGHNRIAIIIPCHRVIGKDGKLRGYGRGLARKQWLLDLEKRNSPNQI